MNRFLIEVSHGEGQLECLKIARTFYQTGSQFLAQADWGCKDGVHKAWVVVEVDTKEEARVCVPHALRESATIVQLNKFSLDEIEELLKHHADDKLGAEVDD